MGEVKWRTDCEVSGGRAREAIFLFECVGGRTPCISSVNPSFPAASLPFGWPLTLQTSLSTTPDTIDQLFRVYCRRRRPWNFPKTHALGAIAFSLDPCRLKDTTFQFSYLENLFPVVEFIFIKTVISTNYNKLFLTENKDWQPRGGFKLSYKFEPDLRARDCHFLGWFLFPKQSLLKFIKTYIKNVFYFMIKSNVLSIW